MTQKDRKRVTVRDVRSVGGSQTGTRVTSSLAAERTRSGAGRETALVPPSGAGAYAVRPHLTGRESVMGDTLGVREFAIPGNGKQVNKLPRCHYCKRASVLLVRGVPQCTDHLDDAAKVRLVAALARGVITWL